MTIWLSPSASRARRARWRRWDAQRGPCSWRWSGHTLQRLALARSAAGGVLAVERYRWSRAWTAALAFGVAVWSLRLGRGLGCRDGFRLRGRGRSASPALSASGRSALLAGRWLATSALRLRTVPVHPDWVGRRRRTHAMRHRLRKGRRGSGRTSPRRATRWDRIVTQGCCWTRLGLASIRLDLGWVILASTRLTPRFRRVSPNSPATWCGARPRGTGSIR